jgi:hypothetical protein
VRRLRGFDPGEERFREALCTLGNGYFAMAVWPAIGPVQRAPDLPLQRRRRRPDLARCGGPLPRGYGSRWRPVRRSALREPKGRSGCPGGTPSPSAAIAGDARLEWHAAALRAHAEQHRLDRRRSRRDDTA